MTRRELLAALLGFMAGAFLGMIALLLVGDYLLFHTGDGVKQMPRHPVTAPRSL